MPSSSAIRAGKAFVEIGGDDSALKRALKSVQDQLKSFGTAVRNIGIGIGALGASITAPLQLAVHAFEHSGTALLDMSKRTGISVEKLSEFQYAAQQTSTDVATFEGAIKKMSKALISADEESQSAQKALARIGLNVDDIRNLKPDEQFEAIAAALNAIADPTLKSAAALAIFGKSGTALLPMIEQMEALAAQPKDIHRMVKRRLADAGLPTLLTCHSFRATTATDLLNQGVTLEDVQELLGHSDPRTTRLYDRRDRRVTRNIVERISI